MLILSCYAHIGFFFVNLLHLLFVFLFVMLYFVYMLLLSFFVVHTTESVCGNVSLYQEYEEIV